MKLNLPDRPADWSDCHSGAVAPPAGSAHAVFRRGLKGAPRWMGVAMVLRNMVVRPFGLVRGVESAGGRADFLDRMVVIEDRDTRFATGMSDRHLTFTLTTVCAAGRAEVTTRIWFHHSMGWLYLWLVMPAHKIILWRMISSLAQAEKGEMT